MTEQGNRDPLGAPAPAPALTQSEIVHNNSTPRYHEASAKLAWERTIAFFKQHLG